MDELVVDANFFFMPALANPAGRSFSVPERDPFQNSTPLCAGPTVGANYRGIVTADVLV